MAHALSPGVVRLIAAQVSRVPCVSSEELISTVQNLRKSLVRNWKPAHSLIGDALSVAEFARSGSGWLLPDPCLQQGMG